MDKDKIDIEIPGYEIIRPLGEGGMARVYLAIQQNFEREVALKIMSHNLLTDPTFGERFTREAKINARLLHPNIVPVYDVGVYEKHNYMAMEHLPGGDLKDKITKGSEPSLAFDVAWQIADALSYAHSKNFVHRDIKPENILFREDGSAVLTDFGIARASDNKATRMTATGVIIGSAHYMSPEQSRAQELDGRTDLYSLGIVFYEALVGEVPYDADSAVAIALKHVSDPVPVLPERFAFVQPFLSRVLAKNPDDRFPDANAMRDALNEYIGCKELAELGGEGKYSKRVTQSRRVSDSGTVIMSPTGAHGVSSASEETVIQGSPADAKTGAFDPEEELPTVIQPAVKVPAHLKAGAAAKAGDGGRGAGVGASAGGGAKGGGQDKQSPLYAVVNFVSKQPLVAGGGVLLMLVLVAVLTLSGKDDATPESAPPVASADKSAGSKPQIASADKQEYSPFKSRINDLLAQAQKAEEANNLALAKEKYNTVLALSAGNPRAKEGLGRLAEIYINKALAAVDSEQDISKARNLVDQTIRIAPEHPRIAEVQQKIQAFLVESGKREQVKRTAQLKLVQILGLARKALEEERFVTPSGNNAYDFYQQVLAIDPSNREALEGLGRLGGIYLERVEQNIEGGDLASAESLLSAARQIAPDHEKLSTVAAKLEELKANAAEVETRRRAKADKIFRLLTLAGQDMAQNRFIEPAGFNAYEKFQKVLALDAENVDAVQGVANISGHFAELCRTAIANGQFEEAQKYIDVVSNLTPNSEQLAVLKEALADLQRSEKDKFERINRIKSLLAKASALLNADKRPLHALNDVQDKLVAVQKMDSQNAELPVLRSLLIEATTEGAMAAAGSRNFKLANSHIALLNTIAPDLANVTQIKAAIAAEKVRIEDERKQRLQDDYEAVKVLIAEANTAIDKDFLSSPKGESALDKLRMVIKVDPDNADAKKAMGRIVRRYITLASLALNDDKMVTAEKYVSNAEGLYEKYKTTGVSGSAVKGIRSSVNRVIQLTDVTLPLKRLRALNKTIKSQSRPVPEDVKEAYEIFLIVASKEPKHKTVKAAKKLIANAYAELSNSAIKKKDNDSAVSYISRGLKVDPNHRGLKRAKKRMQGEESGFMDFLWN